MPGALLVLGNVSLGQKRFDEATGYFQKSLEIDSKYAAAYFGLANMYQVKGQRDQAIRAYRKVLEMAPNDAASRNNLAWLLVEEKGTQPEALQLAQKALELRPGDGRIMDTVGWVYYQQGNLQEAEKQFRSASELLPHEPTIQYHVGLVAYKQGRSVEASSAFKRALLINPEFTEAAAARRLIKELGG